MSRLVYSTDQGRLCPACSMPVERCECKKSTTVSYTDGIVRLKLDRKGRKGKGMTLIEGLGLEEKPLKALAKQLKALCGTGGSVKAGVIEIQGDKRDVLKLKLESMGHKVKLSGG